MVRPAYSMVGEFVAVLYGQALVAAAEPSDQPITQRPQDAGEANGKGPQAKELGQPIGRNQHARHGSAG